MKPPSSIRLDRPQHSEDDQDPDQPPEYTETDSRRESVMSGHTMLESPQHLPPLNTSGSSTGTSTSYLSPTSEISFSHRFSRRMSFSSVAPMSPLSTIGTSPPHSAAPIPLRPRRPPEPINYVFKPASFDSMVLIQSGGTPGDAVPQYRISVRANCFSPSFWITTIRRGGSENGEYVGEFEMGYSNAKPSTLCIRSREDRIKNVFKINFGDYTWALPGKPPSLLWDRVVRKHATPVFTCSAPGRTAVYAKFFPATEFREPGQAAILTRLVIYPDGYEMFDEVLMSALIIERIRTGGTVSG